MIAQSTLAGTAVLGLSIKSAACGEVIRELGFTSQIVFGTFDVPYQEIANGVVDLGIDQNQWMQGYVSIVLATIWATTGQLLAHDIHRTGPSFVNTSNVPTSERVGCIMEAYPICECPWHFGAGEMSIDPAACTPVGESPTSGVHVCACQDVRQYNIATLPHGDQSSSFWTLLRGGALQAGRDLRLINFSCPLWPVADLAEMARHIIAMAEDPNIDAIACSAPAAVVEDALLRASQLTPTITFNAGEDVSELAGLVGGDASGTSACGSTWQAIVPAT